MRIRKRQPPLPLSALSPDVPLPDPHSDNNSPVVEVVQLHNNHHPHHNLSQLADIASHLHPQPSDRPNRPIGNGSNASDSSDNPEKKNCSVLLRKEDQEKSNDSRKKIMLGGAEIVVSESSSSHQGVGRWCEGEKAFPLKKRRGNFERKSNEETTTIVEKEDDNNKKMKTKMNMKFGLKDDDESTGKNSISSAKKRGRGGALMEGSRCSRVNGRGWRCCQQTLVGYSLCEHHLGKGRLRSMTSVRSRALGTSAAPSNNNNNNNTESTHPPPLQERHEDEGDDDDDDEEEEKPLMIMSSAKAKKKKRMKVGMVKARSMSSLLGQTNNEITVSDK